MRHRRYLPQVRCGFGTWGPGGLSQGMYSACQAIAHPRLLDDSGRGRSDGRRTYERCWPGRQLSSILYLPRDGSECRRRSCCTCGVVSTSCKSTENRNARIWPGTVSGARVAGSAEVAHRPLASTRPLRVCLLAPSHEGADATHVALGVYGGALVLQVPVTMGPCRGMWGCWNGWGAERDAGGKESMTVRSP